MDDNKITSLFIYGSIVRGDMDSYSDKDCLIISDAKCENIELYKELKYNGWNCAVYSHSKFIYLKSQQSLYILHLIRESILILDKANFAKNILHDFTPKLTYSKDLNENLKLIDYFSQIPEDFEPLVFFYDIFFVIIRNALIFSTAPQEINFSYIDKVKDLFESKVITLAQRDALVQLRINKFKYRANVAEIVDYSVLSIEVLSSLFLKLFSLNVVFEKKSIIFLEEKFGRIAVDKSIDKYVRLRAFEFLLKFAKSSLELSDYQNEILKKAICEPVNYREQFFALIDYGVNSDEVNYDYH